MEYTEPSCKQDKTFSLKVLANNNNIEKENLGTVISFTVVCVSYALSYKNKVLIKFLTKRREYSLASGQEFHQHLSHNFPYSLTQLFFISRQCLLPTPLQNLRCPFTSMFDVGVCHQNSSFVRSALCWSCSLSSQSPQCPPWGLAFVWKSNIDGMNA